MTALPQDVIRLASAPSVAVISTIMPDGRPQTLFVWIDTDGTHLLVNTEPQRRRVRNIERDPRVTVLLAAADDVHDWAEIRGRVVEIIGGEQARAHIDRLSQKYEGRDYPFVIGPRGRVILRIQAHRVNLPQHQTAVHPADPNAVG